MAEERTPRNSEDRQTEARKSDAWVPQSALPVPAPQEGWVFRWIRTAQLGNSDNTNVSKKFREGWVPVKAEDHKELHIMSDIGSRFEGNIEVGGLLLCKASAEQMTQRTKFYDSKAGQQMESVDNNFLRENDPRMPMLQPDRKTRTTFGSN
tara:strand:- start:2392 stop:2844 length:453 start_codon:yes stop_codon:yes gene_type:complete